MAAEIAVDRATIDIVSTSELRRPENAGGGSDGGHSVVFAGLVRGGAAFGLLLVSAGVVAAVIGTAVTRSPVVPGISNSSPLVVYGLPFARVLVDLGAVAATGLALLPKLLSAEDPKIIEPVVRPARRLAVWASCVWVVAALGSIVLLTAEVGQAPTASAIWHYIQHIAAGKGLLMSAGCALVSGWLAARSIKHGEKVPAELRVGIALFGLLPLSLTGHASTSSWHDLSMVSLELHVVAASAWAGGLGALVVFLVRQPRLLALALPRFSVLATWCVLVVGVTGIFNGVLELALSPVTRLPQSLWDTRYGVLLLAKTGCMAVIAVIALNVRIRILPKVVSQRRTSIALWCGWELMVLAVAFGVAVALTRTPVTAF